MKTSPITIACTALSARLTWAAFICFLAAPVSRLCSAADAELLALLQSPLPKTATFEQIKAKWSKATVEDVRKAAEAGWAEAQLFYADMEFRAASAENNRAFQQRLGQPATDRAFARGREAFEWIKKAADQSLVVAEEEVAMRYLGLKSWVVIPPNEPEGMTWLQRAADHDSEWANHKLADFSFAGRVTEPDLLRGLELLRKSADSGCPRARYELAALYANGNGEPRGASETPFALLLKSAEGGYNKGQAALAERYRTGLGTQQDFISAIHWYQQALKSDAKLDFSDQSHAGAVLDLVDEKLVPKSVANSDIARFAETLGAYLKATTRRNGAAMQNVANLYLKGEVVPRDLVQAMAWLNLAAANGSTSVGVARDELKARLSAEDSAKAAELEKALLLPGLQ